MKKIIINLLLIYSKLKRNYGIPILEYHRISDYIDKNDVHSVYTNEFLWQMDYLSKNNYKIISLSDLHLLLEKGNKITENVVVITFDDGHKDNYFYAAPILRKYKYKATMFLVTDYIGKLGWLNENGDLVDEFKDGYQRWSILNWNDIDLLQDCFWFEAHCKSHKKLTIISNDELMQELTEPINVLFDNLKISTSFYCYPYGLYTNEIVNKTKIAGYKGAVTIDKGTNSITNTDSFKLKRNEVGRGITKNEFELLLKDESMIYYKLSNLLKSIKKVIYN